MDILYLASTGTADPTRASIAIHLAVNGSIEVGDAATIVLVGDATELVRSATRDGVEGVGIPPARELFAKVRQHEVPVFV